MSSSLQAPAAAGDWFGGGVTGPTRSEISRPDGLQACIRIRVAGLQACTYTYSCSLSWPWAPGNSRSVPICDRYQAQKRRQSPRQYSGVRMYTGWFVAFTSGSYVGGHRDRFCRSRRAHPWPVAHITLQFVGGCAPDTLKLISSRCCVLTRPSRSRLMCGMSLRGMGRRRYGSVKRSAAKASLERSRVGGVFIRV